MKILNYLTIFLLIPILGFSDIGDSPPSKMYLDFEAGILNYRKEREAMTEFEIKEMLSQGENLLKGTNIVHSLMNGGSALFPHASIVKCGDQIAAIVQAALTAAQESGKNKILVLGVLHSLSEEIAAGRKMEIAGQSVLDYPCRGIFGPALPHEAILKREYSVDNFLFLLEHAIKFNQLSNIEVVVRFPNHICGQPDSLAGIDELKKIAKESIVVATADLLHHGVNYSIPLKDALPIGEEGMKFSQREIQHGLDILKTNDLLKFRNYCYKSMSDAFEVGQMLYTLLGPLEGHIHNLRLVNVSDLFEGYPEPNWVATATVELKAIKAESEK